MTAPTISTAATVFTICPACGHVGAIVVTAELVRCTGRFHDDDLARWRDCLTEYNP